MDHPNKIKLNLNREADRLKTFGADWPHAYISPRILAKCGFYYKGPFDQVKCNFCTIELSCWEIGDIEIIEHYRWSLNCPLLNQENTANEPNEPILELTNLLSSINGLKINQKLCGIDMPFSSLKNYIFPDFSDVSVRTNSFENWPKSKEQKSEILSEAGFFYTQKGDRVICFSCGGGLHQWEKGDDPWEQHALWYSNCNFIQAKKGQNFIKIVKQKFKKDD